MSEVTVGTFDVNDPELLEEERRLDAERRRENDRRRRREREPTFFAAPASCFDASGEFRD